MGYGNYSAEAHQAVTKTRASLPQEQVFLRNDCDPKMNPQGVKFRESRDSEAHPDSVGMIFCLDVSGSMGEIPHQLATKTLPTFMESVLSVLPDAQVLFMAFGNAHSDKSALQVGQFECEGHLLDRWLQATHLEGGGGGFGESSELALYFASRHTAMDCLEKRGKKGYLFITSDETPFFYATPGHVGGLIGDQLADNIVVHDLAREVVEKFHTFFLIPDPKRAGENDCEPVWRALLRERCLILATPEDTALACALLVAIQEGQDRDVEAVRARILRMGRPGASGERVVQAVLPYAQAHWKGAVSPTGLLAIRSSTPQMQG